MFPSFKHLNDQQRHDYILSNYVFNKEQSTAKHKQDIDIIKENHKFLWNTSDVSTDSWEKQLARRYYDKLFKEYCIADLTRYKDNKVALRWRIESEVVSGKGQFQCGSRKCDKREELKSWEVNFAYQEEGQKKNALVKLRLCPEHSAQLNYTTHKREVKRLKRAKKHQRKSERRKHHKTSTNIEEDIVLNLEATSSDVVDLDKDTIESNESEKDLTNQSHENCEAQEQAEKIWSERLQIEPDKPSRESEFESYLEDLLL